MVDHAKFFSLWKKTLGAWKEEMSLDTILMQGVLRLEGENNML